MQLKVRWIKLSDNEYGVNDCCNIMILKTLIFIQMKIWMSKNMQDDGSPARLLRMNFFNDWEQTHGFRVTSQFNKFQFIAGIYDWEAGQMECL